MSKEQSEIIEYLETSLVGARMSDDLDTQMRLERAIIAFSASTEDNIFSEEYAEKYITSSELCSQNAEN